MSAEIARQLEATNWGWCVVWGAWHRSYTAWALWARDALSVAAATPEELIALMRQAELLYGGPAPPCGYPTRTVDGRTPLSGHRRS